jgi:hypothetical protein
MSAYHYNEISDKFGALSHARPNWALVLGVLLCLFFWAGIAATAGLF